MFYLIVTHTAKRDNSKITFSSAFPGTIKEFNLDDNHQYFAQKSAFLVADPTVKVDATVNENFWAGLFGGEGFIMQKLSGRGIAFIEIDGSAIEYDLSAGESIIVDTGYLAAMTASCSMDIVSVPGIKNALLGGEGLFNTVVKGPGKVILQTMPVSKVAATIGSFIPSKG